MKTRLVIEAYICFWRCYTWGCIFFNDFASKNFRYICFSFAKFDLLQESDELDREQLVQRFVFLCWRWLFLIRASELNLWSINLNNGWISWYEPVLTFFNSVICVYFVTHNIGLYRIVLWKVLFSFCDNWFVGYDDLITALNASSASENSWLIELFNSLSLKLIKFRSPAVVFDISIDFILFLIFFF